MNEEQNEVIKDYGNETRFTSCDFCGKLIVFDEDEYVKTPQGEFVCAECDKEYSR